MATRGKRNTKVEKSARVLRECVTACFKGLPLSSSSAERRAVGCIKACTKKKGKR